MWRLLFVVFALAHLPSASAQVTAITRVTLIDGSGTAPLDNATIVMERGRIRDIGPSAHVAVPPDATVVDGNGRFVVPGIINGHGHVGPAPRDPQLRQYARASARTYAAAAVTVPGFDLREPESVGQALLRQGG